MSFTQQVKKTLCKIDEKSDQDKLDKLAGIVRGAGSVVKNSFGLTLSISTESEDLINKIAVLVQVFRACQPVVACQTNALSHGTLFSITMQPPISEQMLISLHIIQKDAQNDWLFLHDFSRFHRTEESVKNFIAGIFLACGSVNIPANGQRGYHLEFCISREETADELMQFLAEFDFMPKKVARKNSFVVYLKEREAISDFFALMGANKIVLQLQSLITERTYCNNVNRQANCSSANFDRLLTASVKQVQSIQLIRDLIGLDQLKPVLRETADLRLQHPTASLDELIALHRTKMSKSGLNHRLQKIQEIANNLGGYPDDLSGNDY